MVTYCTLITIYIIINKDCDYVLFFSLICYFNELPQHSHSHIRITNIRIRIRECRKYDIRNIPDVNIQCVRKCMSRYRYLEIKRNLHLNDK